MRPLDKGTCPSDNNGNKKIVTEYSQWRQDLIDRIGYYCAYCNMPLSHSIQVEHVVPKKPQVGQNQGGMLDWDNMLLACGPCNNAKGNQPNDSTTHYLPEDHNTHLAFRIIEHPNEPNAAIVEPRLGVANRLKAENTIQLCGLDNIDRRPAIVDIRWKKRYEAIQSVEAANNLLQQCKNSPTYNEVDVARWIAVIAKGIGFFSLWFNKFANEASVMERLIDPTIISGTASACFDSVNSYIPIPRNVGDL